MFELSKILKKLFSKNDKLSDLRMRYSIIDIILEKSGYKNSFEKKIPIALDGTPVPWYTYPAIEYLNQFNARGLNIFEYGCGYSTLFWLGRGANVWSVDHNINWFNHMRSKKTSAKGLYFADSPSEYASAISKPGTRFDLVVIDGAWRNECSKAALSYLQEGGIIVLDNSDWYTDVADFLKDNSFFRVDFNGIGPINNYCWTTSIFIKMKSHLSSRLADPKPLGGIEGIRGEQW